MKAQDLRIGNYVCTSYMEKSVFKVTAIHSDRIYFESIVDNFKSYTIPVYIEPIQLTEEWLLKCGATKTGDLSFVYGGFILSFRGRYNYWYVIDHGSNYLTKVEYVHEWQNFVFVMDGNELTIKL